MVQKFDKTDIKIIEILQENGRESYADIARKLGVAETKVRFRVNRLLKRGVIRKIAALVNPREVGLTQSAAVMIRIETERTEEILKDLTAMREVPHIYQLTGDYDVIAIVMARSIEHLNEVVKKIKTLRGVRDATLSLTMRVVKSDVKYAVQV